MSKPLNLTDADREGVRITFNMNKFQVYAATGWLMFAVHDKAALRAELARNGIAGAAFDGIAARKYRSAAA